MKRREDDDLFSVEGAAAAGTPREEQARKDSPLAARMRPRTLDEFIGQEHVIGPGRLLRRAIQADQLSSIILYGPPGTGKTTLAQIIANTTRARFLAINAVLAGVKDIRESIETARAVRKEYNQKTILFVDEVHRFNKHGVQFDDPLQFHAHESGIVRYHHRDDLFVHFSAHPACGKAAWARRV